MSSVDFDGKVVLITGSSRGIGKAAAEMFAAKGARVAVHYHRQAGAAQLVMESLPGEGHKTIQADMSDAEAVRRMVDEVVGQMGRLDVLVNNAGIYEDHSPAQVRYEEWQDSWMRTLQTNLIGAANAAYCAAQYMIKQGGGRIVNVSSRGAYRGEPDAPAYGASKAGMNAMSQSLAKALAPHNIYVVGVAPGWVETDMAAGYLLGEAGDAIKNQSPLGRVATPDEVAYVIVFAASEGAAFMTGAILDVNGASYLR